MQTICDAWTGSRRTESRSNTRANPPLVPTTPSSVFRAARLADANNNTYYDYYYYYDDDDDDDE